MAGPAKLLPGLMNTAQVPEPAGTGNEEGNMPDDQNTEEEVDWAQEDIDWTQEFEDDERDDERG
jgi:hypothetical protein